MALPGFPIRKSVDITRMCRFPQLIAACHVLHRLLMPRHSPCALCSLIYFDSACYSRILNYASNQITYSNQSLKVLFRDLCLEIIVCYPQLHICKAVFPQSFTCSQVSTSYFCCFTITLHLSLFSFQGANRRFAPSKLNNV